MSDFNQICIWPSTIVGEGQEKAFEEFMQQQYEIRIKYLEEIQTFPDMKNGKSVEGTGGRNDVFFAIHSDDIPKFAVKRFSMDPPVRWIEDVLGNETEASIYPDRVQNYTTWSHEGDE